MKALFLALVLSLGLLFALGQRPDESTDDAGVSSRVEQGAEEFDGVLQRGLSKETHDKIIDQAHASADLFAEFGANVAAAAD